jgi:hypothetical protein
MLLYAFTLVSVISDAVGAFLIVSASSFGFAIFSSLESSTNFPQTI